MSIKNCAWDTSTQKSKVTRINIFLKLFANFTPTKEQEISFTTMAGY